MRNRTCEVCEDVVNVLAKAECGHTVYLCATCKQECPSALIECLKCENGEGEGDAWLRLQERKMGITS